MKDDLNVVSQFWNWIKENRDKSLSIFFIYLLIGISIATVNYPYIDDVKRQITGGTEFAWSYSRWGSEISSWILQGSRHLTDGGWTRPVVSGVLLTFVSLLLVYILRKNKENLNWIEAIAAIAVGINPWFLACLGFRFDSPFMVLSIFVSIIPFLWWDNLNKFAIYSFIGIFLMCNFYQPASGIYLIVFLTMVLRELLSGQNVINIIKRIMFSAIAYISAMLLFLFESKLNPEMALRGEVVEIAKPNELITVIFKNIKIYLGTIYHQSAQIWILLFTLIIVVSYILLMKNSQISKIKSVVYIGLYLLISIILSYGVLLVFVTDLVRDQPRYGFGFGFLIGVLLIIISNNIIMKNWKYIIPKIVIVAYAFYMISFSFEFSAMLSYQKESFINQSMILSQDLKDKITTKRNVVKTNRLFKNSPILVSSERNYPLLSNLVPNNENLYWPNVLLFSTYTGLNVNFQGSDFSEFTKEKSVKVSDNSYYQLYLLENEYYLLWK
ncbi:hypothetical protein RD055328_10190 [Companilactobacillus sp. RD055328]|uniref:glucosyltransferase domain-containing protein n=1 Tax=Companilactobacillus sp. RD055328 TaxID=2916634 RepID=UPI001FC84312|nr:glucosyltransferase domain-containing protein [Companilactobacillus sp. RD055328]GKQ43096.1 hypothetical protein RD055328_10190 [Companilactobacillus sp. RD055328]